MVAKKAKQSQAFNKSYYYLLPMYKKTWQELCYINNTYLFNEYFNKSNFNYYTFVITCFCEDPLIESLPEFLCKEYNQVKDEYVYLLKIPEEFEEDYLYFILGKYSLFSNEYKSTIYKLLGKNFKQNNIYKVLEKDSSLKKQLEDRIGTTLDSDAELLSIFDKNKEIYKG